MIPRGTTIAALLVIELAIIGEAVVAVRASQPAPIFESRTDARAAAGPRLIEGGPHEIFRLGAHPALSVDIGYADLRVVTSTTAEVDVSVSASTDFGVFRATAPIVARRDGETIRIVTARARPWSMGDDRMVTVVVPPETEVTVIGAGDINVTGLRAEASLESVGHGSVTVDDYTAPTLHVASTGRIALHGIVADRLDATSSDGRVEGSALNVRDGHVESDERVTLGFATGSDTLVRAQTSNGRIRVSGFSAAATNGAGRAASADDDSDAWSQTVRVGAGNGRFDVHASDGNIDLAQRS